MRIKLRRKERGEVIYRLSRFPCTVQSMHQFWLLACFGLNSFYIFAAEFELMRKEQHKSGHEKQYLSSVDSKDGLIFDTIDNNGNLCGEKKIYSAGIEPLESYAILAPQNGSIKSSTSMHTAASRPVVPPGFVNTSSVAKSTFKHDSKVLFTIQRFMFIWVFGHGVDENVQNR